EGEQHPAFLLNNGRAEPARNEPDHLLLKLVRLIKNKEVVRAAAVGCLVARMQATAELDLLSSRQFPDAGLTIEAATTADDFFCATDQRQDVREFTAKDETATMLANGQAQSQIRCPPACCAAVSNHIGLIPDIMEHYRLGTRQGVPQGMLLHFRQKAFGQFG